MTYFNISPNAISIHSQWARIHSAKSIKKNFEKLSQGPVDIPAFLGDVTGGPQYVPDRVDKLQPPPEPQIPSQTHQPKNITSEVPKVAIIGAGAAGLFTGMIFDYLNDKCASAGFKVDYEILEANREIQPDKSIGRVGGRLFTYNFEGSESNPQLYYDVGAMRYPDNPVMKR